MTTVHYTVGTITLVLYLVTLILNIRTAVSGSAFSWQRMVSFAAATGLVIQYTLGFSLLGSGNSVTAWHFLLALAAILPVGMEHGLAASKPGTKERGRIAALANVLTFVLVAVAWQLGTSS